MQEKDIRLLMEIGPERESLAHLMRGVELQRTKTTKAGNLLWCKSYPIWSTEAAKDAQVKLDAKRDARGTSDAQRRLNARKAEERLLQIINENFTAGDIFLTLTYGTDKQPEDLTRANRNVRNFLARLRRTCERRNSPAPAYVYVTETLHKRNGTEYHHHMVLRADVTREEAEAIWEKAGHGHCNTRSIKRMREGLIGLGKYMAKQVCSASSADEYSTRHRWCASKGLTVPEATEADRKISRRKVERIAEAMERDTCAAREILERCYPGYEVLEIQVKTSRWVTGAYITAVMARKETGYANVDGRRITRGAGGPRGGAAGRGTGLRVGRG